MAANIPVTIERMPLERNRIGPSESPIPWLQIKAEQGLPVGKWVSITYSASLHGELIRPTIRFRTSTGDHLEMLPAPLFGRGTWVGYLPAETIEVHISVAERSWCHRFRIDAFEVVPGGLPFALAVTGDPWQAAAAVVAGLRSRNAARELMRSAIRRYPLDAYDSWRKRSLRPVEPEGLDRLESDRGDSQHIRVVVQLSHGVGEEAVAATLRSLAQQDYRNFSIVLVAGSDRERRIANSVSAGADSRAVFVQPAVFVPPSERAELLWSGLDDDVFIVPLAAGGTMPSYGLSAIANFSMSHPDHDVIYADEDHVDRRGKYCDPLLKPDWSPIYQQAANYVGRAIYLRRSVLVQCGARLASEIVCDDLLQKLSLPVSSRVGHLRRILLTSPTRRPPALDGVSKQPALAISREHSVTKPKATLVIPTRDRADLLEACLGGLGKTQPTDFEIIIVDNDSREAATFSLYDRLLANPRIKVLSRPGPFNFSALCNSAAMEVKTPVIVFLNNDIIVQAPDWLETLSSWALRREVGAVGTRLVYPSGLLQHAGVVVGLDGYAAHHDRNEPRERSGYLRKLVTDRETLAVTAACMAVEKTKFDSVGGFDASNFPIELGDMDLCLRLRDAGWTTICLSEPVSIHRESATRGKAPNLDLTYRREREAFQYRWQRYIRDDPYFHPALSLYSVATALDR
jgi:GT2 family glycosyltransferase